jgi:fructose-bisphosphate aldolase class II
MSLVTLRQALDEARSGGYGLGAFNVTDILQAEAVLDAAAATSSPVIIETLSGSSSHTSDERFWSALLHLIDSYPTIPVVLHLDHGPSIAVCRRAIEAGFTSVMIDGSLGADRLRPSTFKENVDITAAVVAIAHPRGVSVEGELGTIGGSKVDGSRAQIVLADPAEAEEFVSRTHVDALAVAIGTSHGAYKFDTPPDGSVLHMDLITKIAALLPDTHLVMHGSSSLPEALRLQVNSYGGTLPDSWGVPEDEKARSISLGVRKLNQGMDSHLAFTGAVRQALATDGLNVDPGLYLRPAREAMQALLETRMRIFGQAGHSTDYNAIDLTTMASRYQTSTATR